MTSPSIASMCGVFTLCGLPIAVAMTVDSLGRGASAVAVSAPAAVDASTAAAPVPAVASAAAAPAPAGAPAARASIAPSAGPGLGEPFPSPILATAVRGRIPAVKEPGATVVLAFVRTSEPASRQSIAALDSVARRHAGAASVAAISDEPVSVVRDFCSDPGWSERVSFGFAADPTRNAFQTVFGKDAFPTLPQVFVVRGGVVQWRGAAADAGPVVDEVVAGKWDISVAKRAGEQQRLWEAEMHRIDGLAAAGRHDEALKALDDDCRSAMPAQAATCPGRRFSLLLGARRVPEALKVGEAILRNPANDKQPAGLAWSIANEVPGDKAAMAFALRAAQQSDAALKQRDAMVGAILARVQFLTGDRAAAAATAKRALAVADTPDVRKALTEDLGVYSGKTPAPPK